MIADGVRKFFIVCRKFLRHFKTDFSFVKKIYRMNPELYYQIKAYQENMKNTFLFVFCSSFSGGKCSSNLFFVFNLSLSLKLLMLLFKFYNHIIYYCIINLKSFPSFDVILIMAIYILL